MPGRPHLDRIEVGAAQHRSDVLGMVRSPPEPEHAEEVTEPVAGRGAEVDGHEAPRWPEYAPDLRQPSMLQVVGQVVEHQTAQHRVEVVLWVWERLDHAHFETDRDARAGRRARPPPAPQFSDAAPKFAH
jgi:hypothetical protein